MTPGAGTRHRRHSYMRKATIARYIIVGTETGIESSGKRTGHRPSNTNATNQPTSYPRRGTAWHGTFDQASLRRPASLCVG